MERPWRCSPGVSGSARVSQLDPEAPGCTISGGRNVGGVPGTRRDSESQPSGLELSGANQNRGAASKEAASALLRPRAKGGPARRRREQNYLKCVFKKCLQEGVITQSRRAVAAERRGVCMPRGNSGDGVTACRVRTTRTRMRRSLSFMHRDCFRRLLKSSANCTSVFVKVG